MDILQGSKGWGGLFLLFLNIMILTGGCAARNEGVTETAAAGPEKHARMVTDHLARQVEVPEKPIRILALTRSFMDDLFEMGVTPVGKVEEYDHRPEGKALPGISKQAFPNIEAIHSLKPDIIFANTRQHAQMRESLAASGAAIVFIDPNKVEKDPLLDRMQLMGEALNKQEAVAAYARHLEAVSAELQEQVAQTQIKTGLILEGNGDTNKAAQPTGFYGALLLRLGVRNIVPAGLPGSGMSTWVTFDRERIVREAPDVILLKASTNDQQEGEELLRAFYQNPAWKNLKSVKSKQVYVLPGKISPGNISNEQALRVTADILRGQRFDL